MKSVKGFRSEWEIEQDEKWQRENDERLRIEKELTHRTGKQIIDSVIGRMRRRKTLAKFFAQQAQSIELWEEEGKLGRWYEAAQWRLETHRDEDMYPDRQYMAGIYPNDPQFREETA